MKLGNFFTGNVLTLSQSPHGSSQNGKAIDCVPTSGTRLIAPCDMEIYYRKNDLGHQSYSYARGDGWKMVFVHCIIEKQGHVKKGTDIGYLHTGGAVHLHVAIEVNGVWDVVLNYMDRSIELALTSGFSSQHWKSWSTWKDLTLGPNNMATITDANLIKMRTLVDKYNGSVFVKLKTKEELTTWWLSNGIFETLGHVEGLEKTVKIHEDMIRDVNKRLNEQGTTHEKYIAELNLRYSTLQQQLINCEDDREPLLKKVEDLESKLTTANAELDKAAQIISKLIQDNKGVKIDWGSYINKIIRAIKSFIARNARDNS